MLRHPSFCGLFLVCSGQYLSKLVLNGAVVNQQQRHRWSEAKSEGQCSHIQQMSYYSSNCWKSSCWFLVKGVRMHSLFDMALHSCRRDRVPMLTSVHHWKHQRVHEYHLPREHPASGCTMDRRQTSEGSVVLWTISYWETLGPAPPPNL